MLKGGRKVYFVYLTIIVTIITIVNDSSGLITLFRHHVVDDKIGEHIVLLFVVPGRHEGREWVYHRRGCF